MSVGGLQDGEAEGLPGRVGGVERGGVGLDEADFRAAGGLRSGFDLGGQPQADLAAIAGDEHHEAGRGLDGLRAEDFRIKRAALERVADGEEDVIEAAHGSSPLVVATG